MDSTARPSARDPADFHPLELIPFFRRFDPGLARNVLYTLLWNVLIGFAFWLVAIAFAPSQATARILLWYLVMANVIGYTIHALFLLGTASGLERHARRSGTVAMTLYYSGVSTSGVMVGYGLATWMMNLPLREALTSPRWIGFAAFSSLLISLIIGAIFYARERAARAEAALQGERARTERVEREAALANLRALQAQIEPHFLFNTLANVASLIDSHPGLAKRTVESFNRFLRASLAATRSETTTLAEEGRLISAFLDVLQVRMGERLRYAVEIPEALAGFALPPMLLQPVVENAIRHGLEPKVEGGALRLAAREDGPGAVLVEVTDTGVGFAPTTRGGIGLANLRSRLELLYRGRARLEITENAPAGTRVALRLPR